MLEGALAASHGDDVRLGARVDLDAAHLSAPRSPDAQSAETTQRAAGGSCGVETVREFVCRARPMSLVGAILSMWNFAAYIRQIGRRPCRASPNRPRITTRSSAATSSA